MLKYIKLTNNAWPNYECIVSSVDLLHLLHEGVSKRLK